MTRRTWGVTLALATTGLAAAVGGGCGDDAQTAGGAGEGGSIVVVEARAPDSLDPALASTAAARRAAWLAYTPPLTYRRSEGQDGTELVPALSEELPESDDDGRTYSFRFKRGLRYSDGRPLRARDFEHAVARSVALNPRAHALFADVLGVRAGAGGDIAGIEADDRARTVTIELECPDRLFPYALASTWAAPVPAATPLRDLSERPPPGIGPYRVAQVRRSGDVVLERRRDWQLSGVPAGNPQEIVTRTIADLGARIRAVLDGRADLVEGESPRALLPDIRSTYKDRYDEHRTLRSLYVAIDARRPPFRDTDVRRALSYALDAGVLTRIYGGFMEPSCNALPPEIVGHRPLDPCPYGDRLGDADLVEASQLVEDAEAVGAPVTVSTGSGVRGRRLSRYLVRTLRKIGLAARLAPPATAQIAFASTLPALPHPASYLRAVDDPVLSARVRLLEQQSDPADVAGDWASIDEDVVSRAYMAPYGVATAGVLVSRRIDLENCGRFHPVVGLDYSSVCVR
jgi:peptide/nickel transport system substrate-binding protein